MRPALIGDSLADHLRVAARKTKHKMASVPCSLASLKRELPPGIEPVYDGMVIRAEIQAAAGRRDRREAGIALRFIVCRSTAHARESGTPMKKTTRPAKTTKKANRDTPAQSGQSAKTGKPPGAHADHKPLDRGFDKIARRYSGGKPR